MRPLVLDEPRGTLTQLTFAEHELLLRQALARGLVDAGRGELDAAVLLEARADDVDGRAEGVDLHDLVRAVEAPVPLELRHVDHAVGEAVERDEAAVVLDALHEAPVLRV